MSCPFTERKETKKEEDSTGKLTVAELAALKVERDKQLRFARTAAQWNKLTTEDEGSTAGERTA